jgi:uncharacterized protein YndB with AHSA1/START domain
MVLRERTRVKATAERIWTILCDPGRMSQWNPHCVGCEAGEDALHAGLRFKAVMCFGSGPERQLDCEVIACEPQRRLTLRFSGEASAGTDEYVDETYVFQPVEGGTKVLHETDFSHSGLPWFLQGVMKVIGLLGHRKGNSPLGGLKELAEGSNE